MSPYPVAHTYVGVYAGPHNSDRAAAAHAALGRDSDGYGQDKHETHSGPASPCVEALAHPRCRVWPPEGLPVL
jgi:hypothetical protein